MGGAPPAPIGCGDNPLVLAGQRHQIHVPGLLGWVCTIQCLMPKCLPLWVLTSTQLQKKKKWRRGNMWINSSFIFGNTSLNLGQAAEWWLGSWEQYRHLKEFVCPW